MNPPSLSALVIERLGWLLVHSVWQFLLIAVVAFLCHRGLRIASANARYTALLAALAAMTLAPVTTWLLLPDLQSTAMIDAVSVRERNDSPGRRPASIADAVPLDEPVLSEHEPLTGSVLSSHASAPRPVEPLLSRLFREQRFEDHLRPWFPVIVGLWCLGVVIFALRPALSWLTVRRLKSTGVAVVVPTVRELLQRTAERLRIRSHLTILQSALVQTPMVVGYLRPVILLPVRIVTGLPISQLEAILAHELAHIRRHDYLFNLLQTVIETLFFYHPAVWWISAKLREERENCCDDVAVGLLGNRLEYGRALLALEEQRALSTALSMSWGGGSLLARTRRLIARDSADRISGSGAIISLGLLLAALFAAGVWAATHSEDAGPDELADKDFTPAQIADAIESVMQRFDRVEYEAETTEIRNSNAFTDKPVLLVTIRTGLRYRSDGERWFADEDGHTLNLGSPWAVPNHTVSGFDGTSYYKFNRERLVIGENESANSRLAPRHIFWHTAHNSARMLQALRTDRVTVDRHTTVDDRNCVVVVASQAEPAAGTPDNPGAGPPVRRLEITFSPSQSWLPLTTKLTLADKLVARETLDDLRQTEEGDWYPGVIRFQSFDPGEMTQESVTHVTKFQTRSRFDGSEFSRIDHLPWGYDIVDYRSGLVWHNDPWWPNLEHWLRRTYQWPRPKLDGLTNIASYADDSINGQSAPPVTATRWFNGDPGDWNRADRQLTILFFLGGEAIHPTPQWVAGIKGLLERYRNDGLDLVCVATAAASPEGLRRTISALGLTCPVAIDAPNPDQHGWGRTFTAYRLQSYSGVFLIDSDGKVNTVNPNETVPGRKISQLEHLIRSHLLSAAERATGSPVASADHGDADESRLPDEAVHAIGNEWKRLRRAGSAEMRLWALLKFPGGVAPADGQSATMTITPEFRMLNSNIPGGWTLFSDDSWQIGTDVGCDLFLLPKGTYRMTVTRPGFASIERRITLPEVDIGKPLDFPMTPGDAITGQIIDTDGQPVAGATVKPTRRHNNARSPQQHTTEHLPRESAITDEDGQFRFANLFEGSYTLEVSADGFRPTLAEHVPIGQVRMTLQRLAEEPPAGDHDADGDPQDSQSKSDENALIIEGTLIQEETGEPVPGATIACGAFINATNGGGANAVTDATGRFRLVAPSAGIYNVWVKSHAAGRHLTAAADDGVRVIPGRPARSDLRLVPGRRVTGRLLDPARQPVAGASLGCYSSAHPQSSGGVETSKTDANGEFEFLVPPGRARIHVMKSPAGGGRLTAEVSLEIDGEANPEPVELTLANRERQIGSPEWLSRSTPGTQILGQNRRSRDIVGTVVDNEGRALEGALVFPDGGPFSTTGPKGEFRVAVDRGTQLVLYAFHEGYHVWFGTPMAGDVLKVVMEQKVRPKPAGAGQTPQASNVEGQGPTVKAPGPRDTAQSRSSRLIVRYDLPGAEEVANIVVTASGESVGSDSNGRLVTTPLKNGQQREFTDLPSGDLFVARSRIVEYVKVGSAPFSRPMLLDGRRFVLQAKDESLVEFTRPGARILKGTVRGLRESGLERALLFICSPEIRDERAAQFVNDGGPGVLFDVRHCDADGSFQTEPLSPGDYTVIAAGYVDLPENEKYRLPDLEPRYAASARVTIPKAGDAESIALTLADTRTLDHPVTISGDGIPLEEALRIMCDRAGLRLELDRDALLTAGLDLEERMTLNINNQPLGEVLADLIPWQDYPGVLREVRNGQLRITTLEAAQTRIRERLPEWLKPLYTNGLLATLNDSGQVVTISASRVVDDAFLEQLESLPQLRELSFEVTEGVTADGLECLAKLPALEGLSLYDVNLGGDGLGDTVLEVASRIATLKRLSLVHCGVTDAGLQHLEGMRQLTELGLSQNPITDAGLRSLAGLVELRTLSLASFSSAHYERTQITDAGMAHLVNLKSLQSLEITGQMVSGRFLDFPRLQSLSIGGPAIDNAAAEQIARLRELRQLSLVYTEMTNAGLETIGHLPRLEHLNIDSSRITDAGIAHLRGLATLRSFTLRATGVGDESLRYLAEIKCLERLDLYGSGEPGVQIGRRFSIEGLCQLKALPELRQLSLTNFAADGGFAGLAELQQLRQLNLMMTDIRSDEIELLGAELPDTRIQAVSGSGGVLPKRGRRQVR